MNNLSLLSKMQRTKFCIAGISDLKIGLVEKLSISNNVNDFFRKNIYVVLEKHMLYTKNLTEKEENLILMLSYYGFRGKIPSRFQNIHPVNRYHSS